MSNREKNVRVLIVEDDYLTSEMIRAMLEEARYTVVGRAVDGLQAIEMTTQLLGTPTQPDVILMDIKIPDMDGIETTRLIQERCPTPVVVLTAYETEELVTEASAAGVGAYLIKPPEAREMERAITIAIARFDDMMKLRDYAGMLEQRVKERTAEIQAQYARLNAILSSTTDGIAVTDTRGEILQANPAVQAWLTHTLSPENVERLREAIRSVVTRTEEQSVELLELTGLDLELRAAPILEPTTEEEVGKVVAIHDVSHFKALDRMKTMFISNVSHELRTPITTIQSYAYLMRQTPPEDEMWGQYLDALVQAADAQVQLGEDILQISRIYVGRAEVEPHPTSLNELTRAAAANHQALAQEQGLALDYRPVEPGPVASVDTNQMMRVLNNLVEDAIRYTPGGGQVTVSTGKEEAEGRIWATVSVSDTGEGIPEEDQPLVFERFFREWEPQSVRVSETGLRLMIVKGIVELHDGRVTVKSRDGVGSIFTIWLPLAD